MAEDETPPIDLAFASTDELVDELRRRSEVLSLVLRPISPEAVGCRYRCYYKGDYDQIIPLVRRSMWHLDQTCLPTESQETQMPGDLPPAPGEPTDDEPTDDE